MHFHTEEGTFQAASFCLQWLLIKMVTENTYLS